jgi:hypothetical protein
MRTPKERVPAPPDDVLQRLVEVSGDLFAHYWSVGDCERAGRWAAVYEDAARKAAICPRRADG